MDFNFVKKHATIATYLSLCGVLYLVTAVTGLAAQQSTLREENRAAFNTVYHNEQTNTAQWGIIRQTLVASEGNKRELEILRLLLVGGQLDVDRLEAAVKLVDALEGSGYTAEEVIDVLQTMRQTRPPSLIKSMAPPPEPAPPVAPETRRPQEQSQLDQRELEQYIQQKRGALSR